MMAFVVRDWLFVVKKSAVSGELPGAERAAGDNSPLTTNN
jgi:hypothetical protein